MSFMENQSYFNKNHLQGDSNNEEDNVSKKSKLLPTFFESPIHFDKRTKETSIQHNENKDQLSQPVPSIIESETSKEILQTNQHIPNPKL